MRRLSTRSFWAAGGGIATNHKIVHVNHNTPTAMRSPHEALGHFALECAMDELAYATGIDPVELRLRNDTEVDPLSGRPFSTRGDAQMPCGRSGALRLGAALVGTVLDARRTVSDRSGNSGRDLHTLALAGEGSRHNATATVPRLSRPGATTWARALTP